MDSRIPKRSGGIVIWSQLHCYWLKLRLRIPSAQLILLHEGAEVLEADLAQTQAVLDEQNNQTPKPAKPNRTRESFPAEIERLIQYNGTTSCDCPEYDSAMTKAGKEVSEVLDVVLSKYSVIRMDRPKYGCKGCNQIVQAPA